MPNINKKTCKPEIKINEDYDTVKEKKKKKSITACMTRLIIIIKKKLFLL